MINLFLSASVPLPDRDPTFFETADVIAIREAVKALIETSLKASCLVFGGHPAITPLISLLIRELPLDFRKRVTIFQSQFFENEFVEDNKEFIDFQLIPAVGNDRSQSLRAMREAMLSSKQFDAAIFIGGMEGIFAEYRAFNHLHPYAPCYPIASTGGASLSLYNEIGDGRNDLKFELTYPTLFRNLLSEIKNIKLHGRGAS
jgi:hypothetical protein